MKNHCATRALAALFAGVLVGCGGGGGSSPPPPPVPGTLSVAAGGTQVAPPGTAVAVEPQVLVTDQAGNALAGVEVDFAIGAGGGSVAHASATTDASGRASSGAWTMGTAKGTDTLVASVAGAAGVAPVTFLAQAIVTSPGIVVTNTASYGAGALVGDRLAVGVAVASTNEIASVVAHVADRSAALAYIPEPGNWGNATLDLAGLPKGPIDLIVTATDTQGNASDLDVPLVLDRAATLAVASPVEGALAHPGLDLAITCADDSASGCAAIVVSIPATGRQLASGTASIAQTLDLSAYDGQALRLAITATDSAGQVTTVLRDVYVDSSPHLAPLVQAAGPIWDVSGTRTLFVDATGTSPLLRIADSATAATVTIDTAADPANNPPDFGRLTPTGAIYARPGATSLDYGTLREWRGGVATTLTTDLDALQSLVVAGNWAIWSQASGQTLWLRDLGAGTSTQVASGVLNFGNDVSTDGTVAYAEGSPSFDAISTWRAGTVQPVATAGSGAPSVIYPATDGTLVAWVDSSEFDENSGLSLFDGSNRTTLVPLTANGATLPGDFLVAGGYVAYPKADAVGNKQIWRHGPTGEAQVSVLEADHHVDALLPDGSVMLHSPTRRFLAVPGKALEDVGSSLGRVVVRDGRFVVLLGPNASTVQP